MAYPLSEAKSWIYHLGDVDSATSARIGASSAGLVVTDYGNYLSGGVRAYTPAQLDAMRGSNDKLIVSYLSIGEAEDYRPYWQSSWNRTPPSWLSASNPEWPDNYKVKYWDKAWQNIMFKYVDDIVRSGFNGLYLDIVDAFYYWESVAPRAGVNYRQEMANFVAALRDRAEQGLSAIGASSRKFVVIGQNGEELVDNATYLAAIDGLAKEDLRFYYRNGSESSFQPAPNGWFEGSKPYLEKVEAAGKEVFVVEYMTKARQTQYAGTLKAEVEYLKSKGMVMYIAEDRDLDDLYDQPAIVLPGPDEPVDPGPRVGEPIYGTASNDRLNGTEAGERIEGRGGRDTLDGRGGDDSLYGGNGADTMNGGSGNDLVYAGAGDD